MITTGIGRKFREELALGMHVLAGDGADIIRTALYGPAANIGPDTEAYTSDGEVLGGTYITGGVLTPLTLVGSVGSEFADGAQFENPYLQPTNDLVIESIPGITVRGLMVYNESKGNRNIFTFDFGFDIKPAQGLMIRWGVERVSKFSNVLIPFLSASL